METTSSPTAHLSIVPPRPKSVEETGLSHYLLTDLLSKHIFHEGVLSVAQLSALTALATPVLEEILKEMRADAMVETKPATDGSSMAFTLTDRGRAFAINARERSAYRGPAPVPIEQYTELVKAQSVHDKRITIEEMREAFADVEIEEEMMNALGPAMHSGRAICMYGQAGTGKTYIAKRLARLLGKSVLLPHTLAVGNTMVRYFDPLIHHPVETENDSGGLILTEGYDPRYVLCERPVVITGGELTMDMLEVRYDAVTAQSEAPLQLKATNGIYMIDDLGRQRADVREILNRWIVPMETREDYLTIMTGKRFPVIFDVILIFSTNLHPSEIADEAFLRRLGHKIQFKPIKAEQYSRIWKDVCDEKSIPFDIELLKYTLEELHKKSGTPLLPCHPRDLLSMAQDEAQYRGDAAKIDSNMIRTAWQKYFVQPEA